MDKFGWFNRSILLGIGTIRRWGCGQFIWLDEMVYSFLKQKKKEKIKETRINILASGGAAFPDLRIAACTRQRGHGGGGAGDGSSSASSLRRPAAINKARAGRSTPRKSSRRAAVWTQSHRQTDAQNRPSICFQNLRGLCLHILGFFPNRSQ